MKLLVKTQGFELSLSLKELSENNELTVGQVFHAVKDHYKKKPGDYPRWPSFTKRGEFDVISGLVMENTNDLDKINWACRWLEEEEIK